MPFQADAAFPNVNSWPKISDAKEGSWILGGGWNNDLWGGELPVASWVDRITAYNPVSGDFICFGI